MDDGPITQDERRQYLLQTGLDQISQGLTVMDPELRMVACNRTFLEMLDFPAEFARPGTPFEAFIRYNAERGEYGEGNVEEQVATRVAMATEFKAHRIERVRPDGRVLEIRGEPMPQKGFVTVYTDITDQRRYEALIRDQNAFLEARVRERTAELERTEARLRLITDAIPARIAYLDRERVFRFANKGYADWFGLTKEDIVGKLAREVVGPRVFEQIGPHVDRGMQGHTVTYEYSTQRDDGQVIHARSTIVPEFNAAREVVGLFVLSFDITEERRTQAALMQAQKMEAVGQLTGGLAHDFNNLLTIVVGNLAVLRERHAELPAVTEFVEPALQASRRGVELVKRLLAFSRQQPLEPTVVDVHKLVHGLTPLLRRSLPESIRITTKLSEPSPHVIADANRLESALINIAVNARDAMPEGGELRISISAEDIDGRVAREYGVAPGTHARIEVSDTGIGMDPATLARAVEPFFSTKPFGSGSGLGLSMVYGFVTQLNGGIAIRSVRGGGTTVTILLPLTDAAEAAEKEQPSVKVKPGSKPLVLLVEDEPDVRRIIRMQLNALGYPVLEANNGTEAARMLENVPDIGLLITDMVMPGGLDGRALAEFARRQRRGLRVVFVSGYAGDPGRRSELEDDVPLLAKPFTRDEIAAAIAAA